MTIMPALSCGSQSEIIYASKPGADKNCIDLLLFLLVRTLYSFFENLYQSKFIRKLTYFLLKYCNFKYLKKNCFVNN